MESNTGPVKDRETNLSLDQKSQLNNRRLNYGYNQKIHSIKHWFAEHQRSKSQSWQKDSLNQMLIHWKREEKISVMTRRFTDYKQTLTHWQKWISAMTKRLTDSITDPLNDRWSNPSCNQKSQWFLLWSTEQEDSKSLPLPKDSLIHTLIYWTRDSRQKTESRL